MRKKKYLTYTGLIILLLPFFYYSYTFSKYVATSAWDNYLKSKGFYLKSDYLDTEVLTNVNNFWNGESIYFNIRNNQNKSLITDYDIKYTAVCTVNAEASAHAICYMNGTNTDTFKGTLTAYKSCINNKSDGVDVSEYNKTNCELYGYSWQSMIATKELYFDIILIDDSYEKDITVNISVSSTSPYKKTLKGDFTVKRAKNNDNQILSSFQNYDDYGRLVLTNTYEINKCVSIKWSTDKLILGESLDDLESFGSNPGGYINEIIVKLEPKKSINYIFYKKNIEETSSIDELTISETDCV